MKILVTGTAGFIGHALVKALAAKDVEIVGIDNINDYYDVRLKLARLADTGVSYDANCTGFFPSSMLKNYRFARIDLADREAIDQLFAQEKFTHVVNLAGQAGVRYSIENPYSYVQSNVVGFLNLLEACRHNGVEHLVYASSSSIYGMQNHVPFAETDNTDHPVSLYAATTKSNELMAHSYSKQYALPTTGLRFFTVYGPWGRPDMAPHKFMDAISHGRTIDVYNHGDMLRDFTYIDDIIEGVLLALMSTPKAEVPHKIYNIGCSHPVKLMDFIAAIEQIVGRKANIHFMGMQTGDVTKTYADTSRIESELGYKVSTTVVDGLRQQYAWLVQHPEFGSN